MGKTKSTTEKDSFLPERLFGDHHHVTKITDGEDSVEARGRDAEEAESRASKKWADKKK